jgi:hypothetical protein
MHVPKQAYFMSCSHMQRNIICDDSNICDAAPHVKMKTREKKNNEMEIRSLEYKKISQRLFMSMKAKNSLHYDPAIWLNRAPESS